MWLVPSARRRGASRSLCNGPWKCASARARCTRRSTSEVSVASTTRAAHAVAYSTEHATPQHQFPSNTLLMPPLTRPTQKHMEPTELPLVTSYGRVHRIRSAYVARASISHNIITYLHHKESFLDFALIDECCLLETFIEDERYGDVTIFPYSMDVLYIAPKMAPMRGERGGSPARGARASLPLPRRLIRQIARHVASSGRSLRRLEVSGRVIENFDDLDGVSDESDMEMSPAVACGGNAGNLPPAEHDDDLTSLSWLQDRNLLRGINLTKGDTEETKHSTQMIANQVIVKTESTTPPPVTRPPSPPRTPVKAPPSPPAVTHQKPPYSFSCLIFMAIEAAPARALPVKEIYAWIIRHFPYFRHAPQGWKNSVRHNLSLNKCFHKVAAAPGLGKGSLWTVDPQHRASLLQLTRNNGLQAFGRQPVPTATPAPEPKDTKNTPDPVLFPFLARRLAGSPEPGADEYLAAATVLAMKYGPAVMDQLPPAAHLVISRCARDEHSYSGCEERRTAEALLNLAGVRSEPAPS